MIFFLLLASNSRCNSFLVLVTGKQGRGFPIRRRKETEPPGTFYQSKPFHSQKVNENSTLFMRNTKMKEKSLEISMGLKFILETSSRVQTRGGSNYPGRRRRRISWLTD